jgi:GDP/UDP-N,N'-diacetylbacillosamine 2-epimerase (hydrolysing)
MMKVGVLTSSRADFGIYLPLLKKIQQDSRFEFELIVFGTHLSEKHGYTKNEIINNGFKVHYEIETLLDGDSPFLISTSIGQVVQKFAQFWEHNRAYFDIVLCLGDRFEMFAAVTASIPFGIKLAHIHAGEITLGAIDNIFRHAISHSSGIHFTSTAQYAKRVEAMIDSTNSHIVNVGALSLDTLTDFVPLSNEAFSEKWKVDLSKPTVLTTFHPETVEVENNVQYVNVLCDLIEKYAAEGLQFLITMPNADTSANIIRETYVNRLSTNASVYMVENLGTMGYFTAISKSAFLLGNSSSGIIEAASFKKYVINVGKRQKGRIHAENVIDCSFDFDMLCRAVDSIGNKLWAGENPYYNGGAANLILETLNYIK